MGTVRMRILLAAALCAVVVVIVASRGSEHATASRDDVGTDLLAQAVPVGVPARGAQGAPNFNGRVIGTVGVERRVQTVLVADALVYLKNAATGAVGAARVKTGADGRFEVPPQPLGRYQVCAEAEGLEPRCHESSVEVTANSPYAVRDLVLAPRAAAIHGRVLLSDGNVCYHAPRFFDTEVRARVAPADGGREVSANAWGEYLLGGLTAGAAIKIRATCAGGEVTQEVRLTDEVLSGRQPVDVVVGNARPRLRSLAAYRADGTGARTAAPGATVRVVANADDPDRDALKYRWTPSLGKVSATTGTNEVHWTLPAVEASNVISVEISDGKGGILEQQLMLKTGPAQARFIGQVVNEKGVPVSAIYVTVDGMEITTDTQGRFRISVPERERHLVTVKQPGYVLVSQVYRSGNTEVAIRLRPATRISVDPAQPILAKDADHRVSIALAANALVDEQGQLPNGPLTIDIAGYDTNRFADLPGDRSARNSGGTELALNPFGALSVDITDATGKRYNLAPEQLATITFPAPPAAGKAAPEGTLKLGRYDEATGVWILTGEVGLHGNVYRGTVGHLSVWAGGIEITNWSCYRVEIPPNVVGQVTVEMERRFSQSGPVSSGGLVFVTVLQSFTPTTQINAITHLTERETARFRLYLKSNPSFVLDETWWVDTKTHNPVGQLPLYYPYDECRGHVQFTYYPSVAYDYPPLLSPLPPWLPTKKWLNQLVGNAQDAKDYYAMIGAIPAKNTLAQFQAMNGLNADDQNTVNFYNAQELGLGRRTYCRQNGPDPSTATVACCVVKYGHVGGSVNEALDDTIANHAPGDTVCMEYSPGPAGVDRFAKFYAYRPDGQLSPYTYFDTSGEKFLPEVCMHCHGRSKDWKVHGGDAGGKFVFFDAPAYQYRDYTGPHSLAGQQEKFRRMNQMVQLTHQKTGPYVEFINSLYPKGVDTPGSEAHTPPVLAGWSARPEVFETIVKPNCRTCHIWQSSPFDFATLDKDIALNVRSRICSGSMPNAMSTMLNLWKSIDPFLGDFLLDAYGEASCFTNNAPPSISITKPANGMQTGYGSLGGIDFVASASDNAPNCCKITWLSDTQEVLGYGNTLAHFLGSPGSHTISARATDAGYRTATDSITITLTNQPPKAQIITPAMNNQSYYKGIPYLLEGHAADPNDLLGLSCEQLRWTSNMPQDPFPVVYCYPIVTFATNGTRTLTLTATDAHGAQDTKSVTINVPDPPLNSPPIVTILNPPNNTLHDPPLPVALAGSAIDPDGVGPVTTQWRLKQGVNETLLSTEAYFTWTPGNNVTGHCSPEPVDLCFYGTDQHGTNSQCISVYIFYPPC